MRSMSTPSSAGPISSQERAVAPAQVTAALGGRDLHSRQRELVRLSLLACPGAGDPTHRRWAG
jgi:hypothetical protein